jgi:hypothetical protein
VAPKKSLSDLKQIEASTSRKVEHIISLCVLVCVCVS